MYRQILVFSDAQGKSITFDFEKRADSNKASAMKLFALRRVLNQAAHKIKRLSLPS